MADERDPLVADARRREVRQAQALPILQQFHAWLVAQAQQVLPQSPIAEAGAYALKHWAALTRYITAGFLDIDNNAAEREIKRVATGRKNWLFAGSDNGGRTAAVLFSVTSTCQRHGIDPFAYFRDVFTRLPEQPPDQLEELLPGRWQPTTKHLQPPSTTQPSGP